jgi:hypothetical protein
VTSKPADEDVQRAIDGELWLLQPHVRTSPAEFEALLHPEFFEFGASGRRWSRREVIAELPPAEAAGAEPPVAASDVTGVRLAEDVVLVTYVSERGERRARRSSVWRKTDTGWCIYFHQGTLIPPGS